MGEAAHGHGDAGCTRCIEARDSYRSRACGVYVLRRGMKHVESVVGHVKGGHGGRRGGGGAESGRGYGAELMFSLQFWA